MSDIMNLLDSSLDNLADLEKFTPIPAGTYLLGISFNEVDDEEKVIVGVKLTVKETLEMANSREAEPEPGKETTIRCPIQMKDGSPIISQKTGKPVTFGQGLLKEILNVLQPVMGGESPREIMTNSDGAEVVATLTVRKSKEDPDMLFNGIKALALPGVE